ncbi:hypothetical protein [Ferrovibrio sp.]|uniref:hypothetical protein n=1 Tax=Ferrovibrio sp. TaxID=1917215 RepID=UPI00391C7E8D
MKMQVGYAKIAQMAVGFAQLGQQARPIASDKMLLNDRQAGKRGGQCLIGNGLRADGIIEVDAGALGQIVFLNADHIAHRTKPDAADQQYRDDRYAQGYEVQPSADTHDCRVFPQPLVLRSRPVQPVWQGQIFHVIGKNSFDIW